MGDWRAAAMNIEIMVLCRSDVVFLLLAAPPWSGFAESCSDFISLLRTLMSSF